MTFTQLNPPIPVHVIEKGKAVAFAVIDYGPEHSLLWVSAIDQTGEIWCAPNSMVRLQANWSLGRPQPQVSDGPTHNRQLLDDELEGATVSRFEPKPASRKNGV